MARPIPIPDNPFSRFLAGLSPHGRWLLDRTLVGAAVVLGMVGLFVLLFHLLTDPLADVHAYYNAGARLNAGLPLYSGQGDVDSADFYRYPPLLAILFRPLALLPFAAAALIWQVIVVGSLVLTLRILGFRNRSTWLAFGILAGPIAWAVAIGQAQVVVTLLLTMGNPAAVALSAQLKLLPALVALYWLGRRDWPSLGRFVGWSGLLIVFQLAVEPAGTFAFPGITNLAQVGDVNNLSPYAASPALWLALAIIGAVLVLRVAPSRFGWAAAVAFSIFVNPRLLEYMLMTLLAGMHGPESSAMQRDQASNLSVVPD